MVIINYLNLIVKNDFFIKVFHGFLGNFLSLIIPFLFLPFITRFYSPNDYGEFALFNTSYFLFSIICTGMYSSAIIKEVNEVLTLNLLFLSILISITVSLILLLAFWIAFYYKLFDLDFEFIFYLPVLIFLFGFSTSISSWLQRCEKVKELSFASIINSTFSNLFILIFGYYHFGYLGFVYAMLFGQTLYLIYLAYYYLKYNNINILNIKYKYVCLVARKHSDFPRYNLLLGIFDGLSDNLIVYLISYFFGSTVLGQFSFAKNLVLRPLQVIVSSVNNLFYRRLTIMKFKKENYFLFTRNLIIVLISLVSPFFIILIFSGNYIFSFLFGSNWQLASLISVMLLPKIFINYINGSISATPLVFDSLKFNTIYSTLNNFFPIIIFFILSYFFHDLATSFLGYSIFAFVLGCFVFKWYMSLLSLS
jgi:O-antigen/teichoic acid export membrane protein